MVAESPTLELVTDPAIAALSLTSQLQATDSVIGGLIPSLFPTFVRVMNPAYSRTDAGRTVPQRWADLAARSGQAMSARIAWTNLERLGQIDRPPREGDLDSSVADGLADVLGSFTPPNAEVVFAMWEGYAGMRDLQGRPTVTLPPGRRMYLFRGRLEHLRGSFETPPSDRRSVRCWPNDLTWCIGGDIYARSVVIGCTNEIAEAIVKGPTLEAYALSPQDTLSLADL